MPRRRALQLAFLFALALSWASASFAQDVPTRNELASLEERIAGVLKRVVPATVGLKYGNQPPGASAVIVSADGFVLTAAHCIPKVGIDVTILLPDGRELAGKTLGKNDRRDFGLVKITEKGSWPHVEIGRSAAVAIEEGLLAVGHPGGFDLERGPLVRFGWLLATSAPHGQFFRTSAKVRPGDSGGPLFDLDGRVVGIHSNISTPLDANYHIPTDLFLESWDRLVASEHWEKGGLGARPDPWQGTPYAGLKARNRDEGGIEVTAVQKKAAAGIAGIRPGDIILRVDGEDVGTWRKLARWMRRQKKIGDAMVLTLERDAEVFDLELTLLPKPGYEPKKKEADDSKLAQGAPELSPMGEERYVREFEAMRDRFDDDQRIWRNSVVRLTRSADDGGDEAEFLGTVVDAKRGLILTKASESKGNLSAHLPSGDVVSAQVVRRETKNDLALIRISAAPGVLSAVRLAKDAPDPAPGTFLVAAGSRRRVVGLGVVAVTPRAIPPARPGFLGVSFETTESEDSPGVSVAQVSPGGPAEEAGLLAGDLIVSLDGKPTQNRGALTKVLRRLGPGTEITLTIKREAETLDLTVRLGERGDAQMSGRALRVPSGLSRRRGGFERAFRYDAAVRPQDAGAPVFDLEGRCVGILAAQASRTHALVWPAPWLAAQVKTMIASVTGR